MERGWVTSMVWKPSEWKLAIEQLQNKYRSLLWEISSVVANEESKLSRMEMDARLESIAASRHREDRGSREVRGDILVCICIDGAKNDGLNFPKACCPLSGTFIYRPGNYAASMFQRSG